VSDGGSIAVLVGAALLALAALLTLAAWTRERSRRAAAQRAAAAAAHELALLTAATTDAVSVYDERRGLRSINPAFERLTGFVAEEVAERPFLEHVHPDDRAGLVARVTRLETPGADTEAEYRIETRRGELRWIAGRWSARTAPDGSAAGWIGAERDVTERHRLDERLRRDAELFRTITETQAAIAEAGLDSTAVMHAIVERSRVLTGAAGAAVETVRGDELVAEAASGVAAERVPLQGSLSGLCVRTGEVQHSPDAVDDRRVARAVYMPLGVRSLLVVPLAHEGRTTRVLKVVSLESHAFGEREERALRLLTGLMGAALAHAAIFEQRQQRLEERTRALQESEQRFKQLVDAAQEGIWVLDDRGVTTYVNQRLAELLGHGPGDILGRPIADFVHPSGRGEAQRRLGGKPAEPERLELQFRRKDGGELHTIVATSPIVDRRGEFVGTVGTVTDITERKRAEDRLRRSAERLRILHEIDQAVLAARSPGDIARAAIGRLKRLIPCQRCSVTLFDFEGSEVQVVAGFTGGLPLAALPIPLSAFSPGETLRRGVIRYVEDLASIDDRPPIYETLLAEGVRSLLVVPLLADGEAIGELNLGMSEPGAVEGEHRDIAVEVAAPLAIAIQHARLRDELRRRTAELERRIADRTGELRDANAELETVAGAIAHDLRAPLRQVSGFAQLLLDEFGRRLDDAARHYAERVRDGARDLGTLMDGLLQLVRVRRQDLIRRPTPLGDVVDDAMLHLQPEWEQRQIDWQVDRLPTIDCDPGLARLAAIELLGNAVKFTAGRPRACLHIAPIAGDGLAGFAVQDNGTGFKMAYAEKLFDVFGRAHGPEEFAGAGLGLALVKRVAERHGGRVWAEAQPGVGATFYILLGPEVEG
jgi:PAS domain S-box-containing protein